MSVHLKEIKFNIIEAEKDPWDLLKYHESESEYSTREYEVKNLSLEEIGEVRGASGKSSEI